MKKVWAAGLVVAVLGGVILCGCATAPKGPTDEEMIGQVRNECVAAARAKDVDKLLTYYAENFAHERFGNKAGLKDFLQGAKDAGFLDGLEIDLANAKTTILKNTATFGPVMLKGSFGSTTVGFSAVKEKGVWKITGMDIDL